MLFVNMIWAHAFLLSDKILSLSRCLFLLASVRQPYKSPAAVQEPGSWPVWRPQIPGLHCCASTRRRPFHNSKLYASLEQEDTKVWQYSTDMLYLLFKQEEKTGKIEFPDV